MAHTIQRLKPRGTFAQAALLFAVLAALYLFPADLRASRSASITGDEPFYLVTTQSLIDDGDLDLRNQYEYETYRSFFDHPDRLWRQAGPLADGRLLSPHQPGLSVLLIPGFALGGLRGAQVELALLTALTFALTFVLIAVETGRRKLAWATAAIVGLTAPAFVYATEIYPEMPAALCVVVALLLLRLRPGPLRCLGMLATLSVLAWLGLKYVPVGLVVGSFYLWRADPRERLGFVVFGSMSAIAYGWWHVATFGALTPYSSNLVYDGASSVAVLESHLSFGDRLYRLWGLFVDRRFGIGRWAPILLAVAPALPLVRRAIPSGNLIAALIVTQLLMAAFAAITMMGWWFPGRMLIVAFPLFAFTIASAAAKAPRAMLGVGGVAAAYSLLVTAMLVAATRSGEVVIAVDPFEMRAPLFALAGPLFPDYRWWSGETKVLNTLWLGGFVLATASVAAWPYREWIGQLIEVSKRPFWRDSTTLRGGFGWRRNHGD